MKHESKYPDSFYLFESYFFPSWKELYPTAKGNDDFLTALLDFKESESSEKVHRVCKELDKLLMLDDSKLKSLFQNHFEAHFSPSSRGLTHREWVGQIKNFLLKET